MAESALIVSVPEAEPVVSRLRERFDPSARLGVPAHVTVLYPFLSPDRLTRRLLTRVRAVVAAVDSFTFRLASVARFPDTLYLVPEPSEPFVALTNLLAANFPECTPYLGKFEAIVPHLTVARVDEPRQRAIVEHEVLAVLQFPDGLFCHCQQLTLIDNASGRWREIETFKLRATDV